MTVLLTASGIGRDSNKFHKNILNIIDSNELDYTDPIKWHIDNEFQVITDIFDTREAQRVILEMAQKIRNTFQNHFNPSSNFIIISHSAGSRLVEEALSMLYENDEQIPVNHVMLAPAIGGSDWAKIGSAISSFIGAVLTGVILLSDEDKSIENFIKELLGINSVTELLENDKLLDKLGTSIDKFDMELAPINRKIIFGTKDVIVDNQMNQELPGKVIYYSGNFTHPEVGDLEQGLKQKYSRSNGVLTDIKNIIFGDTFTKQEIIQSSVGS